MRWNTQNLNDQPGDTHGPMWKHGRGWLYFGAGSRRSLRVEWAAARRFALRVSFGLGHDEEDATASITLGWYSLYFGCSRIISRRLLPKIERVYELTYNSEGDYLAYKFGDSFWGDGPRTWRAHGWFLRDVLFGRAKHTKVVLRTEATVIPMPEASYPATVAITRCTWKRPRWPLSRVRHCVEVDIPAGVPFPGKGENSWDCGMDGLYGLTAEGTTIEAGVARAVECVLRDRRRYGGRGWAPGSVC